MLAFVLVVQVLVLVAQALARVAQVHDPVAQVAHLWAVHVLVVRVAPEVLLVQAPQVLALVPVHVLAALLVQDLAQVAVAATDPMVNVAPLARSPADVVVATWMSCSRSS